MVLRDDYRGIHETKYYNSSVNEYFVDKTHFIQEYIKNENSDTYAIGKIMAHGAYDD